MSAGEAGDLYDVLTINKALDDLGMLSSITTSRKEYLQERLQRSMEQLSMDQPGPSTPNCWDGQKVAPTSPSSSTEKENTNIGGFQILKMNSTFITSFAAGYELPGHTIKESTGKRVYKCNFARRRRIRSHPYYESSVATVSSSPSQAPSYSNNAYRLRTTSLSSGTSKNKGAKGHRCASANDSDSAKQVLARSRSMENLSACMDEGLVLTTRPRELESVSRGLQQLCMDDCT